jgi:hypothetical protein
VWGLVRRSASSAQLPCSSEADFNFLTRVAGIAVADSKAGRTVIPFARLSADNWRAAAVDGRTL